MNNNAIRQTATDITRDVLRSSPIIMNADIVEMVPSIVSSVGIDQSKLERLFSKELNGSRNPFNAFLRIFGIRIARIQHVSTESEETEGYSVLSVGDSKLGDVLTIDKKDLQQTVTTMSNALAKIEADYAQEKAYAQEQYNDLLHRKNAFELEASQLRADSRNMTEIVAKQAQKMLALGGKDDLESPLAKYATDLLEDFELNAKWDEIDNVAYFSILKDPNPENRRCKPCILSSDGEVIVKGLCFIVADSDE